MPLIFLLLFGYGISLDAGVLRVAVLSAGAGQSGQAIASDFAHSPWFSTFAPMYYRDSERMMRDSEIQGIVLFRPDFSQQIAAGRSGEIEILVDGSEPNTARFMEMYTRGVILDLLAAIDPGGVKKAAPVSVQDRVWYNPGAKSEYFLVPGAITVVMTLIGTLLTSLVFARELDRGTIESIFTTPVSRTQILLGKLIPYFFLGMAAMAICTGLAMLLFRIPFRGTFPALFLIASVFMLCALGQGLLISVCFRHQLIAAQAGLYTGFLPALLLSGFVFDIQSMPVALQGLSKILPATWFNICVRTLFLCGNIWQVFLPCLLWMGILAAAFLGVVYAKLNKRLA